MTKNQHGGYRPNAGPKTKASKGEHKAKKLSVTIPWSLWIEINSQRLPDEGNSKLIQRLLKSLGEQEIKTKPLPKTELAATQVPDVNFINLTPNSNDAKQFIVKNAHEFGSLDCLGGDEYILFVRAGYDVNEVLEYFQSYND